MAVIGIFARPPKKRCECGPSPDSRNSTIRRHRATGFFYCTKCKRVRKGWQSPLNKIDHPGLHPDWFPRGEQKEAQLHLDSAGRVLRNFPITDRLPGTTPTED